MVPLSLACSCSAACPCGVGPRAGRAPSIPVVRVDTAGGRRSVLDGVFGEDVGADEHEVLRPLQVPRLPRDRQEWLSLAGDPVVQADTGADMGQWHALTMPREPRPGLEAPGGPV